MSSIPQNPKLLKNLEQLLEAHRPIFNQERVYQRVKALVYALLFAFGRRTLTQLLITLGLTDRDWSGWYRIFSQLRFDPMQASEIMLKEVLGHIAKDEILVVGGDGTQTPRTGRKIEGVGYLRCMRTPVFKTGIHLAQRWFNFCIMLPIENGFSRALPLLWLPCFTEKSQRVCTIAYKEWETAVVSLNWLLMYLKQLGREGQAILMVGDGRYDNLNLWKALPTGVTLLARSAKNRVLYHLPEQDAHKNRKYGERALTPQEIWQQKSGWSRISLLIRGRKRQLRYKTVGPVLRKDAPDTPLFLIVVGGQSYTQHGHKKYRPPMPYLVNAIQNEDSEWVLPLPIETLLLYAWQRWELEVCHREVKSNLGLGEMQAWNPTAAVTSVQWVAWCYSLFVLAGYRTWGLCNAPQVPTRWWRGSQRWSFNTLWRSFRASLWSSHHFQPISPLSTDDWARKPSLWQALKNSIYGSTRI